MTSSAAPLQAVLLATSSKTSSSSGFTFVIFLVVIGLVGYFLLLRPQQQKARRQRATQSDIGVGDEILTIGGIVGTVIDIDSEHVTILTGVDAAGDGAGQPTRLVLIRNAIARKIEPVVMPGDDMIGTAHDHPGYGDAGNGTGNGAAHADEDGDQERTDGGSKEGGEP